MAIDLSTCRPSDRVGWDLLRPEDQKELDEIIEKDAPWLLTGSPRCDPFSQLQFLNARRSSPEGIERRYGEALAGLKVAIASYRKQHGAGRYFLHEHPAHAASWPEPCIQEFMEEEGVFYAQGPMCRWQMQMEEGAQANRSEEVPEYVRKETGFLTNSRYIKGAPRQVQQHD